MNRAVGIIISNEKNEILLMQRGPAARSQHGKWENLGSGIEEGETPEQACQREAQEELGIELVNLQALFIVGDEGDGWQVFMFTAQTHDVPEIKEPNKCSGVQWVDKDKLNEVNLTTYSRGDYLKLGWIKN